ncbi:MAG: hypothetical protein FWF45_07955 [Coriobacteriia bacterium]|nr:hypothetical protein [Coriobacteriia bacterium]
MSKIIVECKVPAAGMCVDLLIPFEKPLYETLPLIEELFRDNESFTPDQSCVLCDSGTGYVYDTSFTPEELDLSAGSSLLLI